MKFVFYIPILFIAVSVQAASDLPENPKIERSPVLIPLGDMQPTGGDRVAPEPGSQRVMPSTFVSRDHFYASVKAKLEEDDMRLDNLKLDGPEADAPRLAKIDDELKNLHDVLRRLNGVSEGELKPLEKKVSSHFNNLDNNLSKMESQLR